MKKVKSFKFSNVLNMLKSCLLAILVTLVGVVILAVVLKFTDLNSAAICYINDVIKAIAIFIMILYVKKNGEEKLLIKSIFAGAMYALFSFVIFSILKGGFSFNLSIVYDLLFSVIIAVLVSIILNILKRKTI